MFIAKAIVVFVLTWSMAFLMLLPFGIKNNDTETNDASEPHHFKGAPLKPHLWKKTAGATIIACIVLLIWSLW